MSIGKVWGSETTGKRYTAREGGLIMKKLCVVFVLVLAIQNMFCLNKNDIAFFKTIKTPYGCSFNSKYGEIAYFVYRSPTDFELIYEGSGFITNLTDLIETETSIEVGFIDIWTGAEWTNKGDRRKAAEFVENPIYGYITIDRKLFGDGTNGTNKWKNWKDK